MTMLGVMRTTVGRCAGRIPMSSASLVSSSPSNTTAAGNCSSVMSRLLRCADLIFGMVAAISSSRASTSSRVSTTGSLFQQESHLAKILAVRRAHQFIGAHDPGAAVERQHRVEVVVARDAVAGEFGNARKGAGPDAAHLQR